MTYHTIDDYLGNDKMRDSQRDVVKEHAVTKIRRRSKNTKSLEKFNNKNMLILKHRALTIGGFSNTCN